MTPVITMLIQATLLRKKELAVAVRLVQPAVSSQVGVRWRVYAESGIAGVGLASIKLTGLTSAYLIITTSKSKVIFSILSLSSLGTENKSMTCSKVNH